MSMKEHEQELLCVAVASGLRIVDVDAVLAVATRAADLLAACGGTMTAARLDQYRARYADRVDRAIGHPWDDHEVNELLHHIATQGATVAAQREELRSLKEELKQERLKAATLEADCGRAAAQYLEVARERDTLRAELARLKPSGCDCREKKVACIHKALRFKPSGNFPSGHCGVCGLLIENHPTNPECGALQERADAGDKKAAVLVAALRGANPYLQPVKPSGQVAEDVQHIVDWVMHSEGCDGQIAYATRCPGCRICFRASRLATLAQEAQDAQRHMLPVPGLPMMPPAVVGQLPKAQPVDDASWRCEQGTCGHDDAGKPGHADRVKARSEAFNEAASGPVDVPSDHSWGENEPDPYERGAKAMRAACWDEVQKALRQMGFIGRADQHVWTVLKAAIEGAAP